MLSEVGLGIVAGGHVGHLTVDMNIKKQIKLVSVSVEVQNNYYIP